MNISVTAKNLRQGGDVLTLLSAFQAAGTGINEMIGPLVMIDPDEIARYRNNDQVPIRIGGKFYPVLEQAGGALMGLVVYLQQRMAEDGGVLVGPTTELLNTMVQARRRQAIVRFHAVVVDDYVEVSVTGLAPQKVHPAAVYAVLGAMGLPLDHPERLENEDFILVPV